MGLDAKTGILEWSCKNPPSGRSFKRPPINIKFNGKRFTGEVKFYSERRNKNFVQRFSGRVLPTGYYEIFSDIYNLDGKKVTKPGYFQFEMSERTNINLIKYLRSGVKSNFTNTIGTWQCNLRLVSVSMSVSKDRIEAAEKN